MSDFATGLLLGGGNLFGEPSGGGSGGIDFAARNVNKKLKAEAEDLNAQITQLNEQVHHLKAEATSVDTLVDALMYSLRQENPNHPLVDPFERGTNPLRTKIVDTAYEKAFNDPEL